MVGGGQRKRLVGHVRRHAMAFKAWKEETIHATTQGGQVRNLSMVKQKQQQRPNCPAAFHHPQPGNALLPICLADSLSLFGEGDGSSGRSLPEPGGHAGGMYTPQTTEGQCDPPLPCPLAWAPHSGSF